MARSRRGALAGRRGDRGRSRAAGPRARRLVRVPQPARAVARRRPGGPHPRAGRHRSRGERAGTLDGIAPRSARRRRDRRGAAGARRRRRHQRPPRLRRRGAAARDRACDQAAAGRGGRAAALGRGRGLPPGVAAPRARPPRLRGVRAAVRPGRRRAARLEAVRDLGAGAAAPARARLAAHATGRAAALRVPRSPPLGHRGRTPSTTCCASGEGRTCSRASSSSSGSRRARE